MSMSRSSPMHFQNDDNLDDENADISTANIEGIMTSSGENTAIVVNAKGINSVDLGTARIRAHARAINHSIINKHTRIGNSRVLMRLSSL